MTLQLELAVVYIKGVCGEPPKGCEVGLMWGENDYGDYATVGVWWDSQQQQEASRDYIAKAEVALRMFDDAVRWRDLDPEAVQERFPKDRIEEPKDDE